MPRYSDVETITFIDITHERKAIKTIREIPVESIAFELEVNRGVDLDEVSSRKDVYGQETNYYKIADANIATLMDADFDMTQIKKLKIPIP